MGGNNTYLGGRNVNPARASLIRGKTELIPGLGIVKKLDAAVNFGGNRCKVGQSECEMVTFNE